ncbi:LPS translocon maturation chaperone LptM [Shewanella marina]
MKSFLMLFIVSLCLAGCGQKGPLYKTPVKQDNQQHQNQSQSIKE